VPVAKHGNKALSSKSGSADVLEALGVKLDIPPEKVSKCIAEAGIGFMMAPLHHSAMRHVAAVRRELGTRTIFNLMGPLSNPAGTRRQLIGVYSDEWLEPLAEVLHMLGSEKVWVVHGSDGLDEITTTGKTKVAALDDGTIWRFEVEPEDAGLKRATLDQLKGADVGYNTQCLRDLLSGEKGPYRDIVMLNTAAALMIAGVAASLTEGVGLAADAIDSGKAQATLDKLVAASNA
jgi:anthranilate phosphoribosyltransferase